MSGNYPPGVTENMIPGNRREDILWGKATDEVEDDFVSVCEKYHHGCEYAIKLLDFDNYDPEAPLPFARCSWGITSTNLNGDVIDGEGGCFDYDSCPYYEHTIESRFDEMMREGDV